MKYFWWRLVDYATGVFVGGGVVFLINRFVCHKCLGSYTTILFLGVWIGFMLVVNFIFQVAKPKSLSGTI
jgi:F0F1-type ATP synthase assembly protein I